jgi:hypothetical protein
MKKQITQWTPDTCGCVLEYSWDSSIPAESRVHVGESLVKTCAIHLAKAQELNQDPKLFHLHVNEENTRKNWSIGKLLEALPPNLKKAPYEFKDGEEPVWAFDQDRKVTLTVHPSHKPFVNDAQTLATSDPKIDHTKVDFK